MKSLLAAIAFLTRFPVGRFFAVQAAEVAQSSAWFPLIGLLLGAVYSLAASLLRSHLPLLLVSVLVIFLDAVLTGALHFDGLADTADGFGGGKSREDVLRIMREHSIGSYGALALVVLTGLKVTACAALLQQSNWIAPFILVSGLGRWSILLLTATLPYARPSVSVVEGMGKRSLFWGTAIISLATLAARSGQAWLAMASVVAVTAAFGFYCRRRIAGITGDTLGANLQLCESAAFLTFIWVR
ncbi:MAG TPA: adenosylcobinamide-GDP ribazoletransferase [Bryobacteraceae bacterium]|nr:adenosylcobinamide-GDP ribazoletransferase [Bryobacteraceae bacterium]